MRGDVSVRDAMRICSYAACYCLQSPAENDHLLSVAYNMLAVKAISLFTYQTFHYDSKKAHFAAFWKSHFSELKIILLNEVWTIRGGLTRWAQHLLKWLPMAPIS